MGQAAVLDVPLEQARQKDLGRGFRRALEFLLPPERQQRALWLLLTVSAVLRLFWLARPSGALVFDEGYYVNAARVLIGIPPDAARYQDVPLGIDPNTEHPPLAKLLVAGSMLLFGDNAYGWRIPSILMGLGSIFLIYGIVRQLHPNALVAVLASTLFSFDNLVFVHSRIFTLDIFELAGLLLGAFWYVKARPALAGAGLALGALSKIGGIFGLLVLACYEALCLRTDHKLPWQKRWQPALRRLIVTAATFAATFLVLLGIMDRVWVGYANPFQHVQHILSYGSALQRDVPSGIESQPWQWLWNDVQIPYLRVEQEVKAGDEVLESRPVVLFLGAMNPYVLGLLPLGLAFAAYAWWRRRGAGQLYALILAWFFMTYLPFYVTTLLGHRISYIFYFLPTLPAVAMSGSAFLLDSRLPRLVPWVYAGAVVAAFYGMFPFKFVP